MAFILKRAEVEDASLLAEMRLEMRRERETAVCAIPEEEFFNLNLAFFQTHIADGSFIAYLAWDADRAAACSGLSLQVHPPTYRNPTGKHGYITNIYTRPEWRRMGLAQKLVEELIEVAKREGCAQLFLNASPMGRALYEKMGFLPVDGEMLLDLMAKPI